MKTREELLAERERIDEELAAIDAREPTTAEQYIISLVGGGNPGLGATGLVGVPGTPSPSTGVYTDRHYTGCAVVTTPEGLELLRALCCLVQRRLDGDDM